MKKIKVLFLGLIVLGLLAACSEDNNNEANEAEIVIAVETVLVKIDDLVVEKTLYGRTSPSQISPVIVQVPGEVDSLEVENGDKVKKDDVIAKVNTPAGVQNIKASTAGELANLDVKKGDLVSEENPLAIIIKLDEIKIELSVTDHIRSLFNKKDKLNAHINEKDFEVEVNSIGKLPGETGLYPIETTVKNEDDYILPGMVALISVPEERFKDSMILPTEAIVEESEGSFVFLIEDDYVSKIEVEVEATQSDLSAIQGEVKEGDQIVINGQLTLSDGSKVNIVKEGN